MEESSQCLLGDIGGTNIRFSLHPSSQLVGGVKSAPTFHARYRTSDFEHLRAAILRFVQDKPRELRIDSCALSVCGPVSNGKAICLGPSMGAAGWILEEADLAAALGLDDGARVRMLNDFVAVGLAVGGTDPCDAAASLHTIHAGAGPNRTGTVAVLGPGTGLGSCFGVRLPGIGLEIFPSEGGESDFVARTPDEWALRTYLSSSLGVTHVKVEHVVSGLAISRIYAFLRHASESRGAKRQRTSTAADASAAAVEAAVKAAADPSAVIAAHSTPGSADADPHCVQAMDMFIDALGAEAANLALRFQAFGGVFIAGGVAAKLAPRLAGVGKERLSSAYLGKGRSVDAYSACPLYVLAVEGDDLAMGGAWEFARSDKCGFRGNT